MNETKTKHTPGPWAPAGGGLCGPNGTPGRYARTTREAVIHSSGTLAEGRANIARIVACVNACEGINPEAVPMMLEAAKRMESSVWALAESDAGFSGEDVVDEYGNTIESVASFLSEIRAAIAKAEGAA